jgi:L-serine dehydratase
MELNTSRGVICAAPTAGSAGIVPGCLHSLREQGIEDDRLVNALEVMAVIGGVILSRASFAAEISGCAAETGSAAAMAAGGLAYTYGATPAQVFDAASLCLMNTLGLICDPISGDVEIPCHARNLAGVGHAYTAAASVQGGFGAGLPFDEVADAQLAVGKRMCADFLCTARGGLAATPSAIRLNE